MATKSLLEAVAERRAAVTLPKRLDDVVDRNSGVIVRVLSNVLRQSGVAAVPSPGETSLAFEEGMKRR